MKKNIFFFIDSLGGGGAERVLSILSEELIKRDMDVTIVLLFHRTIAYPIHTKVNIIYADELPITSFYGKFIRKIFPFYCRMRQGVYKKIMIRLGKYEGKSKLNESAFYLYSKYSLPIREYLKKQKSGIAFGFLMRSNICLLRAARGLENIKTVFCERNNPIRPDIAASIVKQRDRLYSLANIGVFQTEEQMRFYSKIHGKKYVIPNPVKNDLPEIYLGERKKEIVNFCRMEPQKNLPLLVDAFEMLIADYPQYRLSLYGNGYFVQTLKDYIVEKGLQEKISINSFVKDVHSRIVDAAMFVSTSDYEGLSNSMLEAMAIGLPCVCTDCDGGGAKMIIKDHENGLLVPKGDTKGVYLAMKEIIEKPDLAAKLSQEGYKIRDELSAPMIVEKWIEVIG